MRQSKHAPSGRRAQRINGRTRRTSAGFGARHACDPETVVPVPMRQPDYRHAVFSVMKRMLLTSGKTSEDAQASPQYAAAIDGLINFWNHSSDFTKSDIQNYVQNKCGLSLQEGISSDSDGLKVLFTLWGGISHYDLRLN